VKIPLPAGPWDGPDSVRRNLTAVEASRRVVGGDLMVEYLVREKGPYLFGVCGHGNIGFLDSALKANDRIKTVMTHHEQTAGFMAEAFYKVSHQLVATYTSCGPGSCNLPVALASVVKDSPGER